jgi:hypothetical protein
VPEGNQAGVVTRERYRIIVCDILLLLRVLPQIQVNQRPNEAPNPLESMSMWTKKPAMHHFEIDSDLAPPDPPKQKVADRPHWITIMVGSAASLVSLAALAVSLTSLKFSEDSFRYSHRGILYVKSGSCTREVYGPVISCSVTISNRGGGVVTFLGAQLFEPFEKITLSDNNFREGGLAIRISPNSDYSMTLKRGLIPMPPIGERRYSSRYSVYVKYRDEFGEEHMIDGDFYEAKQ